MHIVVATLFCFNEDPDELTIVDHLDQDKSNYNRKNLIWTDQPGNIRNSGNNQYQPLREDATEIRQYGNHDLQGVLYSPSLDAFFEYERTHNAYIIRKFKDKGKNKHVNLRNTDNKVVRVSKKVFLKQYPEFDLSIVPKELIGADSGNYESDIGD
jgi:hypothetical protein